MPNAEPGFPIRALRSSLLEPAWTLRPLGPAGARHRLTTSPTLVGRAPGSRLLLADDRVAAEHARIDVDRDVLWVTDLGSESGTTVNRDPVLRSALRARDEVSFGGVAFIVERGFALAWPRVLLLALLLVALAGLALWGRRVVRGPSTNSAATHRTPGFDAGSGARVWYEPPINTYHGRSEHGFPAAPRATRPPEPRAA